MTDDDKPKPIIVDDVTFARLSERIKKPRSPNEALLELMRKVKP